MHDLAARAPFIVISGLIGAGKSTLTRQLAEYLGYVPYYESVEANPYLEDFYKDIPRWTFAMQMHLLAHRFKQHQEIVWGGRPAILDRSIYEDTIFARMHRDSGMMQERDWNTYISHFEVMKGFLRYPDVILYLRVTPKKALERIEARARPEEAGRVPLSYLEALNEGYEAFAEEMSRYTVVINLDWKDFKSIEEVADEIALHTKRDQKFLRSLCRI